MRTIIFTIVVVYIVFPREHIQEKQDDPQPPTNRLFFGQNPTALASNPTVSLSDLGRLAKKGNPAPTSRVSRGRKVVRASARALANLPFEVYVVGGLPLDAAGLALYQRMADAISSVTAVPNDRLNYYSAILHSQGWVIDGWEGAVANVQPASGGSYHVTVDVYPSFQATPYGCAVGLQPSYTEQYTVNPTQGSVTYSGFLDPLGLAGQMPAISVY